jgi:predicted nucleic acid-binding protein
MILADTSVWVDHLRTGSDELQAELDARNILIHPFVVGEVAMGHLSPREQIMEAFGDLPAAVVAEDREVLQFIERHRLFGIGVGYIDVHLLVAVQLTAEAFLWTYDRRLADAANRLSVPVRLPH